MLVCWCLFFGDAGICCLVMQVSVPSWCRIWSASVCCWMILEQVLQVWYKSIWLLRRLVVFAKGLGLRPEADFLKLFLKRAVWESYGDFFFIIWHQLCWICGYVSSLICHWLFAARRGTDISPLCTYAHHNLLGQNLLYLYRSKM